MDSCQAATDSVPIPGAHPPPPARAAQGKLRVGLAEPTVIVALASAAVLSPPAGSGRLPPPPGERKEACAEAAESLKVGWG